MARKLRLQFPGATYLITSRGDRRQVVFHDDTDRDSFISTLAEAVKKTGWKVHAVCLMADHFHLAVETPEPNLVSGMKWFLGTYTSRLNRRHQLQGHVFSGRYRSLLVGRDGGFLRAACDYVHLNPARANLLPTDAPLESYRWSSYPYLLQPADRRPSWLQAERLFTECGLDADTPDGRDGFARRTELRRHEDSDAEFEKIRRGWCFGDIAFRQSMLGEVSRAAGSNHFGSEIQEASEAKAGRIIDEELRLILWTEAELARRRKGDPTKIAIATRLRAETTVTLQWIAARLQMGTKTHLSHLLYWSRRGQPPPSNQATGGGKKRGSRRQPMKNNPGPQKRAVESQPDPVTKSSSTSSIPFPDPAFHQPTFDPTFD